MLVLGLIVAFVAGYATALILVSRRMDKLSSDPKFLALLPEKPQSQGWKEANALCDALYQAKALSFIAPPSPSKFEKPEPVAEIPAIELLEDHPVWIQ